MKIQMPQDFPSFLKKLWVESVDYECCETKLEEFKENSRIWATSTSDKSFRNAWEEQLNKQLTYYIISVQRDSWLKIDGKKLLYDGKRKIKRCSERMLQRKSEANSMAIF